MLMDRPASVEQDASVEGSTGSTRKRRNRAPFQTCTSAEPSRNVANLLCCFAGR